MNGVVPVLPVLPVLMVLDVVPVLVVLAVDAVDTVDGPVVTSTASETTILHFEKTTLLDKATGGVIY